MNLKLYGFGHSFNYDPFSWDKFVAGLSPMSVIAEPTNANEGHWRFEHPTHMIRFYAPVSGSSAKTISSVHFYSQDIAPVGCEDWWLEHPIVDWIVQRP